MKHLSFVIVFLNELMQAHCISFGVFLTTTGNFHGLRTESGLNVAVESVNDNKTLLPNQTLELEFRFTNCNKKKILSASIDFVTSLDVDAMIGDVCQVSTELGGLIASDYNLPFFDFGTTPMFLRNPDYGNLLRTRGGPAFLRQALRAVWEATNFRAFCLVMPARMAQNVQQVMAGFAASFAASGERALATVLDAIFVSGKDYFSAARKVKTACRGKEVVTSAGGTPVSGHWHKLSVLTEIFLG